MAEMVESLIKATSMDDLERRQQSFKKSAEQVNLMLAAVNKSAGNVETHQLTPTSVLLMNLNMQRKLESNKR
eukprot:4961759-Amphidinium_carterae.1